MKKALVVVMLLVIGALAGCGESIHWFPGSSSGSSQVPVPPPSGATAIPAVQQDTVTTFLSPASSPPSTPYQVRFNNITTSTASAAISIYGTSGGNSQYSINGGAYTSANGTVKGGDLVTVQHTSSNQGANQTIQTVLNIGGATATYTSTTSYLSFQTRLSAPPTTVNYVSSAVNITSQTPLPSGFTFPAVITLDTANSTGTNSRILINGLQQNNYTIDPATQGTVVLQLSHDTPAGSKTSAVTVVTLTPTSPTAIPYKVTYKTTNQ
jgi:hypothetical protein